MSCSVLIDCPCTMFRLYVSTHIVFVAILFFGWGLGGGGEIEKKYCSFVLVVEFLVLFSSSRSQPK